MITYKSYLWQNGSIYEYGNKMSAFYFIPITSAATFTHEAHVSDSVMSELVRIRP